MILRILNFIVIAALVLAAADVYRIKFDSTVQAERLARIRSQVRGERDTIAALRARWGELDNPARIEELAKRFLPLKQIAPTQFDSLDNLPPRPPGFVDPDSKDPLGVMIEDLTQPRAEAAPVFPTEVGAGSDKASTPSLAANAAPAAEHSSE